MPFYIEQLGATDPGQNRFWTGLCLAAPATTLTLAAPLWGRLGDRFGFKWMVVRALLCIAGCVLAMSLSRTPLEFFMARVLQGAFGGVDDAAAAFAGAQCPAEVRGRAMGQLQASTAAGALMGPLLGGFLCQRVGFSPVLGLAGLLIGASGLCSAWKTARAPKAEPRARPAPAFGSARSRAGAIAPREPTSSPASPRRSAPMA